MPNQPTIHPFTSTLLTWYRTNGRDLPWRHTTAPYPIWLSEVILQQTRISQGIAYWERFMSRFPTVESLAGAEEDEVLRLWQGLGYYSRARNLHAAAKQIVKQGYFPDTLSGLLQLKGVGEYTAAAIASFAFHQPAAVVDGNVYRVLSRYFGIEAPIDTPSGKSTFKHLAQSMLSHRDPSSYNQGIMDFGALVCTPGIPSCTECPLHESCEAYRGGIVHLLPVKSRKAKTRKRHLIYIYVNEEGKSAWRKRPTGDIWAGLWEPLLVEDDTLPPLEGILHPLRMGVRHLLTHQEIIADFYLLEATEGFPLPEGYQWIAEDKLIQYGHSRLVGMLLEAVADYVSFHVPCPILEDVHDNEASQ